VVLFNDIFHFPLFDIKKTHFEGNMSHIILQYETFYVTIEFFDIKNEVEDGI
jgi:hypothetical protein